MDSNVRISKRKIWFTLCATCASLVVATVLVFLAAPLKPMGTRVDWWSEEDTEAPADWEVYVLSNGKKTELAYDGFGVYSGLQYAGQTFYASTVLNEELDNALLEIANVFSLAVFLDNDLLYASESCLDPEIGQLELSTQVNDRTRPTYISLPSVYLGKTLTIAQAQPGLEKGENPEQDELETAPQVFMGPVSLMEQIRFDSEQTAAMAQASYPAVTLTFVGMLLLIAFLYRAYRGTLDFSSVFFGGFVFLWMAAQYSVSRAVSPYYAGTVQVSDLLVHLSTICLFVYLGTFMHRYRLPMYVLAGSLGVITVICWLASSFSDEYLTWAYDLPVWTSFSVLLASLVFSFLESRAGIQYFQLFVRLLCAALLGFVLCAAIGALNSAEWVREMGQQWILFLQNTYPGYFLFLARIVLVCVCSVCQGAVFLSSVFQKGVAAATTQQRLAMAEQSVGYLRAQAHATAVIQHDMRHHLRVLGLYLRSGDVDSAVAYLQEVATQVEDLPTAASTGNDTVDLILNAEISVARDKSIEMEVKAAQLPALPLTEPETASLLLNTLDNAIAAAGSIPDGKIWVQVYVHNGFFCYTCDNTAPQSDDAPPDAGHGYGRGIVQDLIEKKGGVVLIEQEDGLYRFRAAIPLRTEGR